MNPSVDHPDQEKGEFAMSKRGRPFQSGNRYGQGRPAGSPNKKSWLLQHMLLNEGEAIILKLIELARKGDRTARTLCVERLIPRLKDLPELPLEQLQSVPNPLQIVFLDEGREYTLDEWQATNARKRAPGEE